MTDEKEKADAAAQFSILSLAQWMCGNGPRTRENVDLSVTVDSHMTIVDGGMLGLEHPDDGACLVLCIYADSVEAFRLALATATLRDVYAKTLESGPAVIIEADTDPQ